MPMPKPKKGESREDFMSRCHSSLSSEFEDSDQRNAVCARQWRSRKKTRDDDMTVTRNRQPSQVRAKYERSTGLVRLNVPLSVKADTIDMTERTFEGLAATWDEDLGQDIIHKGAFKASIANWKASGEAMPLVNSHDHFDIFSALGQALAMKETPEGLWTKWEVLDGEDGDRVLARIRPSPRTGRALIGKMSIGFVPTKFEFEQPAGTESFWDRIRHINEADLKEVSLVLFPMNPNASIDASTVKMWLKMAHDADPRRLDNVTRLELRRLNTRIGLLLKKQKPEDDEELEDSEDEQTPSTREPSTPPAASTADSEGADDEEDAGEEEVEEEDDPDTSEDPDDGADEAESSAPTEKKEEEPKTYIFSEALQQRIQKVTLQHRLGTAK
jgi:HK97 family phage prohead protease